jgi:hypothetical protein
MTAIASVVAAVVTAAAAMQVGHEHNNTRSLILPLKSEILANC